MSHSSEDKPKPGTITVTQRWTPDGIVMRAVQHGPNMQQLPKSLIAGSPLEKAHDDAMRRWAEKNEVAINIGELVLVSSGIGVGRSSSIDEDYREGISKAADSYDQETAGFPKGSIKFPGRAPMGWNP